MKMLQVDNAILEDVSINEASPIIEKKEFKNEADSIVEFKEEQNNESEDHPYLLSNDEEDGTTRITKNRLAIIKIQEALIHSLFEVDQKTDKVGDNEN